MPPFPRPPGEAESFDFLAPPQAADEIGRLGGYRILRVLGEGGMGVVFLAEDVHLQRTVALKVMLPEIAQKPSARERFLREARAAAQLEDDHIVAIHQVGEDRGVPFIAMPFLQGASLEDYLAQREAKRPGAVLKLSQVLKIGREIARGLAAAHARGLIHRDIKPANIWLDATVAGRVKILDFGLARAGSGEKRLTQTGAILGTPAYMAPEQAQGGKVDHRADLFSLGVVLYRLCTGVSPFNGPDVVSTLLAVAMHEPAPPRTVNPDVPGELSDLVMTLLAKDPARRITSARDVVKAILVMEKDQGVQVTRGAPVLFPPVAEATLRDAPPLGQGTLLLEDASTGSKKKRRLVVAGVLLVLVGAVVFIGQMVSSPAPKEEKSNVDAVDAGHKPAVGTKDKRQPAPAAPAAPAKEVDLLKHVEIPQDLRDKWKLDGGILAIPPMGSLSLPIRYSLPEEYLLTIVVQRKAGAEAFGFSLPKGDARFQVRIDAFGSALTILDIFKNGEARRTVTFARRAVLTNSRPNTITCRVRKTGIVLTCDGKTVLDWKGYYRRVASRPTAPTAEGRWLAIASEYAPVQISKLVVKGFPPAAPEEQDDLNVAEIRSFDGHTSPVCGVAISPDGLRAVSCGRDEEDIRVWDVSTGKSTGRLEGHSAGVSSVVWSADGRFILSASSDKTLRLWDAAKGKPLLRFDGHTRPVARAVLSSDGRHVLSWAAGEKFMRLWNAQTGKELRQLLGAQDGAAFCPDNRRILTFFQDGRVRLWDLTTGKVIPFTPGPNAAPGSAKCLAVSADGRRAVGAIENAWVLDMTKGTRLHTLPAPWQDPGQNGAGPVGLPLTPVRGVAFLPDSAHAVTASPDKTVRLWDVDTGWELCRYEGHTGAVNAVAVSADGRLVISGGEDRTLRLWRLPVTGESSMPAGSSPFDRLRREDIPIEKLTAAGHGNASKAPPEIVAILGENVVGRRIVGVAATDDGRTLALAGDNGQVVIRQVGSGRERICVSGLGSTYSLHFSHDGALLGTASNARGLSLWDVKTGRALQRLSTPQISLTPFAFLPDDRLVAFGDRTHLLMAKVTARAAQGTPEPPTLETNSFLVYSIALSPDGSILAAASSFGNQSFVKTWSTRSGKLLRTISDNHLRSQALAFTREGNRLVQARAKSLFIHDVETGAQVGTFSDHKLVVTALAMSQDGKTVASSDFGGTIFLWDPLLVKTQRAIQLSPPPGQNGRRAVDIIDQVLFAADGRHLLIRKREGTVLILRLAPPRASDKNGAGQ